MFKDMSADPYLNSAGISSNWPYGRGCYVSEDKQFIVWVGEEDHLRIMCMMKGTVLNNVFDRLRNAEKVVEQYADKFARSEKYGFVTSCPSNLGTGMRASVHVRLPALTKDGSDKKAKEVCKPLGLSVRGLGGEHTPIGDDGTVDISPSARLMIEEADIICRLFEGIKLLMKAEKRAEAAMIESFLYYNLPEVKQ
jgi:creatine kinase